MDREQAVNLIRSSSLSRHANTLEGFLKASARVLLNDEEEPSARSYLGGLPLVPREWIWPTWDRHNYVLGQIEGLEGKYKANPRATGLRDIAARMRAEELNLGPLPLQFFGQVSLPELAASAPLSGWPREGTLAFFGDPSSWGFDPRARGHCCVSYFGVSESLEPAPIPEQFPSHAVFPKRSTRFVREWTLPTYLNLPKPEQKAYTDLRERLLMSSEEEKPVHRLGGHPQEVQGDMRLECQLVTNGLYCGDATGYEDPRRSALEEGVDDWELLLQVDSDERMQWMWGDAGRVYFWNRRQDIEAADFENPWLILQCY